MKEDKINKFDTGSGAPDTNLVRLFFYALVVFLVGSLGVFYDLINENKVEHKNLIVGMAGAFVVLVFIFGLDWYFRKLLALNRKFKESSEYLQHIIDSSLDVIITVNEKREITKFNKAAEKVFGYTAQEMVGKHAEMLYLKPDEGVDVHFTILQTGRYVGEIENISKDGDVFPSFLSASMLKDDSGNFLGIMGISRDITEVKRAERALKKAATIDKLTQVYNRHTFEDLIEKEIDRARRYNSPMSLVMFDLDHFKMINDTYGHSAGDIVLRSVSGLVKGHIRASDSLGRWGGEEFMLLLPEKKVGSAVEVAEKLRTLIEELKNEAKVTASFGVTEFKTGDTIETICDRVDNAMYEAKKNGRNRVETG